MINTLTGSIGIALDAEFGDRYGIHMEEVKQDLREPCFFIFCINPSEELLRQTRYRREDRFCIQYLPEMDGHENEKCHAVAERLFSCLRWLDVAGVPVMGTGMKYEMVDSVLHFFVNYNMFIRRAGVPAPPMEELTETVSEKGQVMR